jgi:hypothetical protein
MYSVLWIYLLYVTLQLVLYSNDHKLLEQGPAIIFVAQAASSASEDDNVIL